MKKIASLIFVLIQSVSLMTFAQNKRIGFERIGIKEGLSDPIVLCMMQDSRGFIWVGTRRGLNRYDGHQFKVYLHDVADSSSLSNNYIKRIIEDSKGNIWIATAIGLNKFDRQKNNFKVYFPEPNNPNSISSDDVRDIVEDSTGKLWVATKYGANLFDPGTNQFIRFFHDNNNPATISDNNINSILADSKGDIWVGTLQGGLNKFNRKDSTFIHFKANELNSGAISGNSIYTIFEDSRQRLWAGTTGEGLKLFDRETGKFRHFKHSSDVNSLSGNNVLCINEDDKGNLLIGVENGGINVLDSNLQKFSNYANDEIDVNSLSANSVYSIIKDNDENIWIGVFAGGINLYKKTTTSFNHFIHNSSPGSLSHNFVLSIYGDDQDNLWVGTDGGGLNWFHQKTGKKDLFKQNSNKNSIAGDYINAIAKDDKDNLWIGTWGNGVSKLNLKTGLFTNFRADGSNLGLSSDNVHAIKVTRDGRIWIGTFGGGLDVYDDQKKCIIHFKNNKDDKTSLSDDKIYTIVEDKSGNIWIGTAQGGINIFQPKTNSFISFNEKNNKLNASTVYDLLETSTGTIYASTAGSGLNYYDPSTQRFLTVETKENSISTFAYAALEDLKGNIWVSTNNGLSNYNPKTKIVKNYSVEDGLQADEFKPHSAFRSKSGMLYFGGVNGYNSFCPEQIIERSYNPPIVLTDFRIFNRSVPIAQNENDPSPLKQDISETKSLQLRYDQSFVTFEFASLDFSFSNKKMYAYILKGFDKDWNIVGTKNSATYTNLSHGDYIFKVKSMDRSGLWSSKILTLYLTVVPPFWLTWWFKTLAILAFLFAIYLAYYFRLKSYREKQIELSELVEKRTHELTNANKIMIEHQSFIEVQSEELRNRADNLKEANDQLVQKQKLIQLQTNTIQESNEELTKLNKTKDRILSIIAHDLRNPFNVVSGFSEILLEEYHNIPLDKIEMYLKMISNASKNGNTLLGNLLQWSRTQTGNITFEPIQLNLMLLTEETYSYLEGDAHRKNIKMQMQIDPLLNIIADENMLKTILRNLLSNAIKFTNEEGTISVKSSLTPDYVEICVSDSGVGVPEEKIPLLFNIDTNISTKGTSQESGSGLGLILCKEFVEKHQGRIWVESNEGVGSQFKFTLPLSMKQTKSHSI
jgi:signal transduction histidine kinase/ligand-binding sensor domain-containing protein